MEKMYTIKELEDIMEKELEEARAEIRREFDKTLTHEKGCRSNEDIYNALLVLGGAEGFKSKILSKLREGEEERTEESICDRCRCKDICNGEAFDEHGVCHIFSAKF